MEAQRIDKWLWTVRLFKTRSMAAEAVRGGKVKIDEMAVKPSREVKAGDIIEVQLGQLNKKIRIVKLVSSRVSAKLVDGLIEDLTPAEEYERLQFMRELNYERRDRGSGRPTKKDRRNIDRLKT